MLESAYLMQARTAALSHLTPERVVALNAVRRGQWYAHPIVAAQVGVANLRRYFEENPL